MIFFQKLRGLLSDNKIVLSCKKEKKALYCRRNNHGLASGFSLVEILIVVTIIAVMSGAAIVTIKPGERLANTRDNQRESHAYAIWHSVEERRQRERGAWENEGCEPLPTEETLIASNSHNGYNLYACIYSEYLSKPFIDPIHEDAYFNSHIDDYNTGTFYIAIDYVGNIYIKVEGEARDIYIGTDPDEWPEYLVNCDTVGPGSVGGDCNILVEHGENAIVVAIPATGYSFSHWSGDAWGVSESFTIIDITKPKTITANFLDACGGETTATLYKNTYDIVVIGEEDSQQCWMAENINEETANSWCYAGSPANCSTYGRLYSQGDAETVCPSGWRLPTDQDFKDLEIYLGMCVTGEGCADDIEWRGDGSVGQKLKSISWDGTNSSGFNALPGGIRVVSEAEGEAEVEVHYWHGPSCDPSLTGCQTESFTAWWYDVEFPSRRAVLSGDNGVDRRGCSIDEAYYVRCIKGH